MRWISLTSCIGKVVEYACLNRVTTILEKRDAFGTQIFSFRKGGSTQDAMLQIKEQVINAPSTHVRALLGFQRYVSSFLTERKLTVKVDGAPARTVDMGGAGTPQGSVLSPMLFNLIIIELPDRLDAIEGINHTIYADSVTVWTTANTSIGEVQERMQQAVRAAEWHLEGTGLFCSPDKLEILLHRPRKKGPHPQAVLDARRLGIRVMTKEGTRIPTVSKIRVLGLWLEENGVNHELVARLQKKVATVTHLNRSETEKLNAAIRRAFKIALGVLQYTETRRLLELGVHNTLDEIAEAQRIAQLERAAAILKVHGSQEGVLFVNAARYRLSAGGSDEGRSEPLRYP
ncbi:uncharacterized protein LOC142783725 [Rhipicephalus microplus]|uniref:uncharacterized protein LOC142783725 n=1 Tax=Rhipicephalus microplus TaxID=6941 RepID=UPI003F6CF7C5